MPAALLLVLALCVLWIVLQKTGKASGTVAEVRVEGQTVLRLSLNQNSRHDIAGANGIRLTVVTENGAVYVEKSGCPDKICVHKGRIDRVGDTIVCLPARTVVEVTDAPF